MKKSIDPSSFRDPSGFVFIEDGTLYRQVNDSYRESYDLLMGSGLYETLARTNLMVPHEEISGISHSNDAYKILKPYVVPFISYPYEWCYSQLKDAALLTLDIQKKALAYDLSLKDASAFNVQFVEGKPIFIDTTSFEPYQEGEPWVAYRQFCMHFLAPLALMSFRDAHLNEWFRVSVDGVPLDLAVALLPIKSLFNLQLFMHIFLHAKSQKRYADKTVEARKTANKLNKFKMLALVDSLESAVKHLKWDPKGTEWADYYQATNYSDKGLAQKTTIVLEYITLTGTKTVWDLGSNDGTFSRIASSRGIFTVAFDIDPACVEKNYLTVKSAGEKFLLPLMQDVTNPSPGLGWANSERATLTSRGPCGTALALALIHHLAIAKNVPIPLIADYFARFCNWLIIEFVPKEDSQVQRLLSTRQDIFCKYNLEFFEADFSLHFDIIKKSPIINSCRVLYLMKKKAN